jgi:hypothetical protein
MSFETKSRTMALDPKDIPSLFGGLLEQFGEELHDGQKHILTIGAHWDDSEHTRIRAASLTDGTITPQPLTDGRVAFTALWQTDLAVAYDSGKLQGVEELSPEKLLSLTPTGKVK